MAIMSEWVYGNGKRQRRGEEVSNVFSVKFSHSHGHCCQLYNTKSLCGLHIANTPFLSAVN